MRGYDCNEKKLLKVGNYAMTGRVLGKGQFARVQEATHIHLNVKVAIKVLSYRDLKDDYVIKNMRREAKILAKTSHPNIIFLFETITTTKRYYIITELVNGGDLCTYITSQRTGKLDEKQTRPLARQIISAVAHLHERGIVHRDLKMENILLDETKEKIKLVDFGLSNYRQGNELLLTHCGSPEYAAPELYISGRKYGPEVDIWSLGVIFYGMLVGRLPFQSWHKPGLTAEAKRKQLIRETKIGLTHRHQRNLVDVSLLFRNLIERMLCPNPEDRITMLNLQSHAWIYGRFYRAYPQLDAGWKRMALSRIAKMFDLSIVQVCQTIETKRYAALAGVYNIAKQYELQRLVDAESLRNTRQEIQKKKSITIEADKPLLYPVRERMPVDRVVITAPPPCIQTQPPRRRTMVLDPKEVDTREDLTNYRQQKTQFTIPNATTAHRQRFPSNLGATISRILKKQKPPSNEQPATQQVHQGQVKERLSWNKSNGIPMNTAARAVARADFDKRVSIRKSCEIR